MSDRFEDILNDCIDALLRGESVEQCLQRYPQHAPQLEPLLRTALAAHDSATSIEPRPDFKAQVRYQLQAALHDRKRRARPRWVSALGWLPRWATITVAIVLIALIAGGSTVAASSGSVPGDTLYPVKLATERVQMAFTFSDAGRVELEARFASRRIDEMQRVILKDDPELIEELASRFEAHLQNIEGLASRIRSEAGDGQVLFRVRMHMQLNYAGDMAKLDNAIGVAPGPARPPLMQVHTIAGERYRAVIQALGP